MSVVSQPISPTKENDGKAELLLRLNSHQRARKCSEELLSNARVDPARWRGKPTYDSMLRRTQMREIFEQRSDGLVARDWQLDISEALDLQLDVTAILKTGAGKTVTCALPLLAPGNETKIGIVIAPLLALEDDHVSSLLLWLILTQYALNRFESLSNGD